MVRRVKAYLKTMKVITNEEELHKMSQECEPPLGGLPPPPPPITMVGMGGEECEPPLGGLPPPPPPITMVGMGEGGGGGV